MAVTIDPRPSYFGDRMIVTGSYAGGDGTSAAPIDLTSLLASIDSFTITPTAAPSAVTVTTTPTADLNMQDSVQLSGTTVILHQGADAAGTGASVAGKFIAIGRRN